MSAPTRTWTVSWNNVPASQATKLAQAAEILYQLKTRIIAAAGGSWQVDGSSNGAGAGAMDATDRWSSAANVIWASAGNRSWIVLSKTDYPTTGNKVYLTIDCSIAAGSEQLVDISWATAIPTGGSATAAPTQPTNFKTFASKQFIRTPVAALKYHILTNTAGDWHLFVSADGSGYAMTAWSSKVMTNFDTGAKWPWMGLASFADSGKGGFTVILGQSTSHSVGFQQTNDAPYSVIFGPVDLNVAGLGGSPMGQFDSAGSDISGQFPAAPVLVFGYDGSVNNAFQGAEVDLWLAPTHASVAQGTERPTGTSQWALVGEFWVPNGNITPNFS